MIKSNHANALQTLKKTQKCVALVLILLMRIKMVGPIELSAIELSGHSGKDELVLTSIMN